MKFALIAYLAICVLVGWAGANRKLGFWAYFFGAVAFTPLFGLMLVLVSDRRSNTPAVH